MRLRSFPALPLLLGSVLAVADVSPAWAGARPARGTAGAVPASGHGPSSDSVPVKRIRDLAPSRVLSCAGRTDAGGFQAGVFFGDAVRTPAQMRDAIRRYARRHGAPPGMVKTFHSLQDDFSASGVAGRLLRAVLAEPGVMPLLSIEPTWHGSPGTGLLALVAGGGADDRLRRMARGLADAGGEVRVELGAEMNARFGAPWQAEANGGEAAPEAYVRAWRHVVHLAREEGAANVRWVFAPSAGNPWTHLPTGPEHWNWYGHWYPGDEYTGYLGLHAFNHAVEQGAWVPFVELVTGDAADDMLRDMVSRFPRHRVILGEIGSSEHPERPEGKAAWITDAYGMLRACPAVAGAVWFDMDKEADWRLDSSPAAAAAYAAVVRGEHPGPGGTGKNAVAAAVDRSEGADLRRTVGGVE